MNTFFRSIVLYLLLISSTSLSAQKIIWVSGEETELKIPYSSLGVFEDTSASLSFEEIRSSKFQKNFKEGPFLAESGSSNYWLKMVFVGEALKNRTWYLEGRDPNTKFLDFYIPDKDGKYKVQKSGNFLPHRSRPIPHKNFFVEFPQGKEEITVFVRVATYQRNYFVFRLKAIDFVLGYSINEYLLLGIFYGILLIMGIYNLVLYSYIKDKTYLWYVFYVLSAILMCLAEDGLGFQYLWKDFYQLNAHVEKIASALFLISFVFYSNHFLSLSKSELLLFKLILGTSAIALTQLLWLPLLNLDISSLGIYIAPVSIIFIVAIKRYKDGYRPALFFLIALSFVMTSTSMLFANKLALFDWDKFSSLEVIFLVYALNFALIFELVILSFAQAIRLQVFQKEQQEVLQDSELRFRGIFETSFDAIMVYDKERRQILQANKRTSSLFAYSIDEIYKLKLEQILEPLPEERNCFIHFVEAEHSKEETHFCETRGIKKNQKIFSCEITITPLTEQGPSLYVIAVKDISKQKQAEHKLEKKLEEIEEKNEKLTKYIHSNSELQNFAYVASHDMRQPLRTIRSFSQLIGRHLKQHEVDIEDVNQCLEYIISGAGHLDALIHKILEHAKVDNLLDFEFSQQNLAELLSKVEANLYTPIKEADAKVICYNLPSLSVEPRRIMQLFQNLISNSLKFKHIDRPCRIEISAREMSLHWLFQVKDNGIGIPKEKRKEVFKLFTKLHGKIEYPGHGIGLATCQKIVEAHGGSIWIHAEESQGCSIYFSLKKDLQQVELAFDKGEHELMSP